MVFLESLPVTDASPAPIRRALFSVSDKTGLVDFAQFLVGHGVELLSTGGTAKALADAGLPVVEVADFTGFPEMLDGRVKTLHPKVHGGILALRDKPDHQQAMETHDIPPIDMVVVNLYPFESTVARGADFETCIENIDIGGPSLIRGAAKNHGFVTVITDPEDYAAVQEEMAAQGGSTSADLRRKLAAVAYARTGAYDAAISQWFQGQVGDTAPRHIVFAGRKKQDLRYGENPHQSATFYVHGAERPGLASARQLQGKELSYNNINDTDAAFELVSEFQDPAVAIIKHANPCGVATADSMAEAYLKALDCDPVSAFGGIIAL
ncbi:MAG: bifunctional phosphoribosylaminoimidazolecarboxamide formyltransferase/IMP cyclohydrolase, partial [Rhodospirillaceae bacterium]